MVWQRSQSTLAAQSLNASASLLRPELQGSLGPGSEGGTAQETDRHCLLHLAHRWAPHHPPGTMAYFMKVKVAQPCPILCNPMDYTVHGILQTRILEWVAFPFSRGSFQPRDQTGFPHCKWILYQLSHQGSPRILEWVAYPFSRGSSQPRDQTQVSCIAGRFFTSWATREAQEYWSG